MDAWPLVFNYEPGLEYVVNDLWETAHQENARFMREMVDKNRKILREAEEEHLLKKNRNNRRYEKPFNGNAFKPVCEPSVPWTTDEMIDAMDAMRRILEDYKLKGLYTYRP
jgi:hypothetical protein